MASFFDETLQAFNEVQIQCRAYLDTMLTAIADAASSSRTLLNQFSTQLQTLTSWVMQSIGEGINFTGGNLKYFFTHLPYYLSRTLDLGLQMGNFLLQQGYKLGASLFNFMIAIPENLWWLGGQLWNWFIIGYNFGYQVTSFILSNLIQFIKAIPGLIYDLSKILVENSFLLIKNTALLLKNMLFFVLESIRDGVIECYRGILHFFANLTYFLNQFYHFCVQFLLMIKDTFIAIGNALLNFIYNIPSYLNMLLNLSWRALLFIKDCAVDFCLNIITLFKNLASSLWNVIYFVLENSWTICKYMVQTLARGLLISLGIVYGIGSVLVEYTFSSINALSKKILDLPLEDYPMFSALQTVLSIAVTVVLLYPILYLAYSGIRSLYRTFVPRNTDNEVDVGLTPSNTPANALEERTDLTQDSTVTHLYKKYQKPADNEVSTTLLEEDALPRVAFGKQG